MRERDRWTKGERGRDRGEERESGGQESTQHDVFYKDIPATDLLIGAKEETVGDVFLVS